MTRIIKFRYYLQNLEGGIYTEDLLLDDIEGCDPFYKVIARVQFTGLLDSKGREIYEGDILQFKHDSAPVYNEEVQWHDNGWWMVSATGTKHLPNQEYREVIGNIYENPTLLNQ